MLLTFLDDDGEQVCSREIPALWGGQGTNISSEGDFFFLFASQTRHNKTFQKTKYRHIGVGKITNMCLFGCTYLCMQACICMVIYAHVCM